MIALGLILLILGLLFAGAKVLVTIGAILLVLGVILALCGASVSGRRMW